MNSGPNKKSTIRDILMKKSIPSRNPISKVNKSISKEKSNFVLQNKIFTKKFDKNDFYKNIIKTELKINPMTTSRLNNRLCLSAKQDFKQPNRMRELEDKIEKLKQVNSC
jgi:hypothetical protein